jgi:archaellum component FlaG (FlaF/FlaG flagellin family)
MKGAVLTLVLWFGVVGAARAQNTNQVLGQVNFEGKTNIDKSSGVWVDGQYLGYVDELKGNKKLLLVPGKHEIAVRQVGYKDIRVTIEVNPGGTNIVTVRMEKDPNSINANATGEVKLKVTPDRAAVFVDGNYAGYVHQFGGVKRAMLIAPGKHRIKIALPGYRDFETEITVRANQKVTVKTELVPASITAEAPELK